MNKFNEEQLEDDNKKEENSKTTIISIENKNKSSKKEKKNNQYTIATTSSNNVSSIELSFPSHHLSQDDSQEIAQTQDYSIDKENPNKELHTIPPLLKKTMLFSVLLFMIGVLLILVGIAISLLTGSIRKGLTFFVLGCIVIIPGGFYSYQFYRLKKTNDEYERDEIIDQIPEL